MKLLFATFTLLAAAALASAGAECQWGPSYWCQSLETAQKCGQVRYCQNNIWQPVSAQDESADACDICKFVVTYLDKFIDSNTTEEEAESLVKELCNYLGSFAPECDALIDAYFPQIWDYLEKEMEPDVICVLLKLCTNTTMVKDGNSMTQDACDICKFVATYLDNFLEENTTESEAEGLVKELCSYLGSFAAECDKLVDQYFPDIWKLLENELEPDVICVQLGLCPKVQLQVDSAIGCEVCKFVVTYLDKFVDDNSTEADAKAAVEKFCSVLGSFEQECKDLVNDYFDIIWKMLEEELSPDVICAELKLCTSTAKFDVTVPKVSQPEDTVCDVCKEVCEFLQTYADSNATKEEIEKDLSDLCNLFPGNYSTACQKLVEEYFPQLWAVFKGEVDKDTFCYQEGLCKNTSTPKQKPTQNLCDLCKLAVEFLRQHYINNSTEAEAEAALEQLCAILPSQLSAECKTLVEQYFPDIWKLLENEVKNDEICIQLGLCTNSTMSFLPVVKESEDLCDLCKLIVRFIKPFIENNSTEDEVKEALEKLCGLISKFFPECDTFLEEYFPIVWALIEAYLNEPDELCQVIKLCDNATVAMQPKVSVLAREDVSEPETFLCVICEFVMKEIDSLLVNNATEDEIVAIVEKVCDLLPSTIRKDCDEFISEYGKKIIQALVDGVAPRLVCTVLHLCLGQTKVADSIDDCTLCKDVLTFVKEIVGENFTKADVEKALDYVCSLLPSALKDECDAFVKEYAAAIIQLIDNAINPEEICEKLHVCTTSALASPWKMLEKAIRLRS